jgi:hypothetical protein
MQCSAVQGSNSALRSTTTRMRGPAILYALWLSWVETQGHDMVVVIFRKKDMVVVWGSNATATNYL